jgi:hypothetical protein
MVKLITLLFSVLIVNSFYSQTFATVNELIALSKKDPSSLEKTLNLKGFKFVGKDGERQEFSKFGESISYEMNPRVVQYNFTERSSYLEFYTHLQKGGYVISKGKVTNIDDDEEHDANIFDKGKVHICLVDSGSDEDINYTILIYPFQNASSSGSTTQNSAKDPISYGNMYLALLLPKSKMASPASQSTTIQQDFQGQGGMGATAGFEGGWSGVVGSDLINSRLPYFLDLGLSLKLMGGIQPFSYESLGTPFDDYKYNGFVKAGLGGGPAVVLSPFRETDFRMAFYYDFLPSVNLGGSIVYNGPDTDYSQSIEKDAASFALIKVFGFSLKYQSLLLGIETSNYIDKADYTNSYGYTGNMGSNKFQAKLPVKQLILKIGYCF